MCPSPAPPPESTSWTLLTRKFGLITVREDQVLYFSNGLYGFPHLKRYLLLEDPRESPLLWLQGLDQPEPAFVVLDPEYLVPDYRAKLLPRFLQVVAAASPEELRILVILTIAPSRPQEGTANLMAPLVINVKTRRGMQIIVEQADFSHQYPVFPNRPGGVSEN